jgi:hypothetical protein
MKVVAFITDYAALDRIIDHLNLTFVTEKPPPSRVAIEVGLMMAEAGAEVYGLSGDFLVVRNDDSAGQPPLWPFPYS